MSTFMDYEITIQEKFKNLIYQISIIIHHMTNTNLPIKQRYFKQKKQIIVKLHSKSLDLKLTLFHNNNKKNPDLPE